MPKSTVVPGSRHHRRLCKHEKTEWQDRIHGQSSHKDRVCLSCGKTLEQTKPEPIPFTRERVLTWVMPWGAYEGKRLIEIPREHLELCLTILQPGSNPHRAITACLEMFPVVPE